MWRDIDPTLGALLDMDGAKFGVDAVGDYQAVFRVTQVTATDAKPHGLDYSLVLLGPDNERLLGFDNAHPVGRQRRGEPQDHRHLRETVRPYAYRDAGTLMADFWHAVDAILNERGGRL